MSSEYELIGPPADGITSIQFSKKFQTSNHLLVSSWDSKLRLYDVSKNVLIQKFGCRGPILDCTFSRNSEEVFCGGLEKALIKFDLSTSQECKLGIHAEAIRCVASIDELGLVASGGWDMAVKLWDQRQTPHLVAELKQPGKVFAMDAGCHHLVVGSSGRNICVYDTRNLQAPIYMRESPLKYQTRCIKVFPNDTGFALGSIEGRVALEYFAADTESQKKSYGFKCHRQKMNDQTLVFPVNAIAFHPQHGTFATGGCDGGVNMWDGENKKRICQLTKCSTSISSLDFNIDGSYLAIAASYTFEEGIKDHPSDAIFLRPIQEGEILPKSKSINEP